MLTVVTLLLLACSVSANLREDLRLKNLKRELEIRLIQRELQRDNGMDLDEIYEDRPYMARAEGHLNVQRRQVIQDCIQGDVIFVVDSSGSIQIENWPHVLNFMNSVIDKIGVSQYGTHIGLVTYGNKAHIIFNLNNYTDPAPMKAAVSAAKFLDENTNTSGGIKTALDTMFTKENGDREKAPNIMVIITDGVSTYDNATTIPNAVAAKNKGILVVSIGVGTKTSQAELDGMASIGKDGKPIVFEVGSYDALNLVNNQLANVACDKDEPPANVTSPANPPVEKTPPAPENPPAHAPPQNPPAPAPNNCSSHDMPIQEVICPDLLCKNKCFFGFSPTPEGCLTCQCLPEQKPCP